MGASNEMHVSEEAGAELSSLKLVEFALIGMGLMIAAMSVAIFISM